jgi:hypothetical protein
VAAFEAIGLVVVLPCRHKKFSRSAVDDRLREFLPCLRQCQLRQSRRRFNFDISTRLLDQYFLHFGEYGGWGFENALNDFGHTFAAAWRKFNLTFLGVRDKFGIRKSC